MKKPMANDVIQFITMMAAFIYPSFATYKASGNHVAVYKWLRYWIVNALFYAILYGTDPYLYWLPLYGELKLLINIGLLPTAGNGSDYILGHYIVPFMVHYQREIDEAIAIIANFIALLLYSIYKLTMFVGKLIRIPANIGDFETASKDKDDLNVQDDQEVLGDQVNQDDQGVNISK